MRTTGRPRREQRAIDDSLRSVGGARQIVLGMEATGKPWREMVAELERMTGVRICVATLRNWVREWRSDGGSM